MFEVKSMTAAKGFTKEQQKFIADEILKEINANKNISAIVEIIKNQHKNDIKESLKEAYKNDILELYYKGRKDETLKIKLPNCNFKLEIINSICILIDFLTKKIHVNVQLRGQKDIVESSAVDDLTEAEEKEINLKFMKAEAEEKEKEKKDFVSVIDKVKSDYLEKKEIRNNFAELPITKENVKAYLKADNECEKAYKKYEKMQNKHINYITGHEYSGHNLEILEKFKNENNYKESAWLGAYQAKKINLQLKKGAKPVQISVIIEKEENKTTFKKIENIYNIADFEQIKKIEETEDFKSIVNELKKVG